MKGIALLLLCAAAAAQASSSCTLDSVGVLLPHPKCDHYYMCFFGSQVELHCADGLLFNHKLQVCDWPHNVDCGDRIIPSRKFVSEKKIEKDVRSPAEICAAEGSEGLFFDHEYCDKYYKCNHGKPVTMPCPPNLLWRAPFCHWAEQVDCGDRIRPDGFSSGNQEAEKVPEQVSGGNSDPSQAPAICAAEGSDGVLVAHENCNQFYKCYRGEPAALYCPQNLLYNPEKEYCDWDWNVNCGNRVNPSEKVVAEKKIDQEVRSESPSEICAAENSEGLILPHEYCDKFYICNHGRPVTMQCPPKLFFSYSQYSSFCIFAGMVNCGNRIIPDDFVGGNHNN